MLPEWAMGVGVIIVAVFGGIGLLIRTLPAHVHKKKADASAALSEELRQRLDELDEMRTRLAEVEERLDFAERLLASHRATDRLPPTA
jgi:hypothetical protein